MSKIYIRRMDDTNMTIGEMHFIDTNKKNILGKLISGNIHDQGSQVNVNVTHSSRGEITYTCLVEKFDMIGFSLKILNETKVVQRRKAVRAPLDKPIRAISKKIAYQDKDIDLGAHNKHLLFDIIDISSTGVLLASVHDFPMDDLYFNIAFDIDGKAHFYDVKVVRKLQREDKKMYGCEFFQMAENDKSYINRYVNDILIKNRRGLKQTS